MSPVYNQRPFRSRTWKVFSVIAPPILGGLWCLIPLISYLGDNPDIDNPLPKIRFFYGVNIFVHLFVMSYKFFSSDFYTLMRFTYFFHLFQAYLSLEYLLQIGTYIHEGFHHMSYALVLTSGCFGSFGVWLGLLLETDELI